MGIPPDRKFVDFIYTPTDKKLSQKNLVKRNQSWSQKGWSFKIDGEVKKVISFLFSEIYRD